MEKFKVLSRNQVKFIAMVSMLIDHFAAAFIPADTVFYTVFRGIIGRVSFPLFAVLFVDGFFKTKNPARHVIDLFLFGLLAEPFYDFALFGGLSWFDFARQNVLFTWCICFLGLWCTDILVDKVAGHSIAQLFVMFFMCIVFGLIAEYLRVDYSSCAVICVFVMYSWRKSDPSLSLLWLSVICSAVLVLFGRLPSVFLSVLFVLFLNESKVCSHSKFSKYSFYLFYPLHLCIFSLVRLLFL